MQWRQVCRYSTGDEFWLYFKLKSEWILGTLSAVLLLVSTRLFCVFLKKKKDFLGFLPQQLGLKEFSEPAGTNIQGAEDPK